MCLGAKRLGPNRVGRSGRIGQGLRGQASRHDMTDALEFEADVYLLAKEKLVMISLNR